jgi:hypothetical protein
MILEVEVLFICVLFIFNINNKYYTGENTKKHKKRAARTLHFRQLHALEAYRKYSDLGGEL